jgi:ribose transport system ATP-binding protein
VSGKVIVHGNTTTRRDPVRSWQDDSLGFVSEDRKADGLLLNRSLVENLSLTRTDSYRRGPFLDLHRMREATRKWMAALDVRATDPDQSVGELSGGNQQKIAFGRLLHHDCDILLLDEPTRGIDIGSKSIIYKAIGELAAAGKAILLASSYLPELLGICNTIGVVSRGRLVDVKPRSEWNEHSLLAAAIGQAA